QHFEKWFKSAETFLKYSIQAIQNQDYKYSAFQLHQATERFFMTTLLVFTGYKPKLHDLEKLNRQVINQHRSFLAVFPQSTEQEKENFVLLKRAYIDSRYDMENYHITKEQLEWLAERVAKLKELTQKKCQEKIESFDT
ncbi:MAG: HEPN domain-containing protein, partial [Proteobacteria bacterium]|nr:HEPN domain-containing protein [Pseudomonadota bacterium]